MNRLLIVYPTYNPRYYPLEDIDQAIDDGIDLLRSDVETIFRQLASKDSSSLPNALRTISKEHEQSEFDEIERKRQNALNNIEVFSPRNNRGKRMVGKIILIYAAVVLSIALFGYK